MSIQDLTLGLVETAKRIAEDSAAYKKFFNDSLKKFGVTSPEELSGDRIFCKSVLNIHPLDCTCLDVLCSMS